MSARFSEPAASPILISFHLLVAFPLTTTAGSLDMRFEDEHA